jgi:hypothetical protein
MDRPITIRHGAPSRHPATPSTLLYNRIQVGAMSIARQRAANAIRYTASLHAGGGGGNDARERRGQALRDIAVFVEQSDNLSFGDLAATSRDREVAAMTVYSLAMRRSAEGSVSVVGDPTPRGWVRSQDDWGGPIHPLVLREAATLYAIAIALHFDEYWKWTRALLLERLGEFAEAAEAFESMDGSYAKHAVEHAQRCRQKQLGIWNSKHSHRRTLAAVASTYGRSPGVVQTVTNALNSMRSYNESVTSVSAPGSESKEPEPPKRELQNEQAAQVAEQFAQFLIAGSFVRARQMLSSDLSDLSSDDLKKSFLEMTCAGDEEQIESDSALVCVMSTNMYPHMHASDLASVYVAISGVYYNEAVSVIVTLEDGEPRIRELEWGRP